MTEVAKVVNYTAEQVATMLEAYTAKPDQGTVEQLASQLGKTVRSVIAKLSKEGVYQAKGKTAGKRDMLKKEMVTDIAKLVGRTEEQVESLEKATGPALMAILTVLKEQAAQLDAAMDTGALLEMLGQE